MHARQNCSAPLFDSWTESVETWIERFPISDNQKSPHCEQPCRTSMFFSTTRKFPRGTTGIWSGDLSIEKQHTHLLSQPQNCFFFRWVYFPFFQGAIKVLVLGIFLKIKTSNINTFEDCEMIALFGPQSELPLRLWSTIWCSLFFLKQLIRQF